MSGHNKWSKIKNAKEKNDQQNAKMFTKKVLSINLFSNSTQGYNFIKNNILINDPIYSCVFDHIIF